MDGKLAVQIEYYVGIAMKQKMGHPRSHNHTKATAGTEKSPGVELLPGQFVLRQLRLC